MWGWCVCFLIGIQGEVCIGKKGNYVSGVSHLLPSIHWNEKMHRAFEYVCFVDVKL